jgi:AcrR family transcriptional regulator
MYVSYVTPSQKRKAREEYQLPPGRHGLPRAFVAKNQRDRILAAVGDVVSLAGYGDMNVEDIVVTAGVSRRTFYDHFKSKDEAFLAAYDEVAQQLVERVVAAFEANTTIADRAEACLGEFLRFLASEPAFADMCIVEVMAAGAQAIERRNGVMKAFAMVIQRAAEEEEGARTPPPLIAETIVGGIYEVVYTRILQGKANELPGLLPDLVYSTMLPYMGHEVALSVADRIRAGNRGLASAGGDAA